jgi:hypothetical protein
MGKTLDRMRDADQEVEIEAGSAGGHVVQAIKPREASVCIGRDERLLRRPRSQSRSLKVCKCVSG